MSLEFRHIAHVYGQGNSQTRALEDISFTAQPGEITCLLGQSGCGKSTLLNLAAGLLDVQQGTILAGGEVLAEPSHNPPPENRPVGLVFQDGALFPHMTIAENIGFGLAKGNNSLVDQWLERVGLGGLGTRYPHQLSGGQQQRAALARAMAPGPQVLLLDEPFASVDIVFRRRLRRDCRMVLREQGATAILVTHDPAEALDVADRIAIMEAGRIVQFGTPQELRDAPATASVGAMFGGAQIVRATHEGSVLHTPFGDWPIESVMGQLGDEARFDLLVSAKSFDVEADDAGLHLRDRQSVDGGERLVLIAEDGSEIIVEGASDPGSSARYRITPREHSVRAYGLK